MVVSKVSLSYLLVVLYLAMGYLNASGPQVYRMICDKSCILIQENAEIKVATKMCFKTSDSTCIESMAIADDGYVYTCKHESRSEAACSKSKELTFLLELIRAESQGEEDSELLSLLGTESDKSMDGKRSLPFETLSYGKRKRSISALNEPKQQFGCDCSGKYAAKRHLPFETLSYGKRSLPFETLSYGKREDSPRLAYILGKRTE